MAKQTQRQKAKKAREADASEDICCLPHCDAPGVPLECGHKLCVQDLLKLVRYSSQIEQYVISCPMCRQVELVHCDEIGRMLNELPFRCAVFQCGCRDPACKKYTMTMLRPCRSHKIYLCQACKDLGTVGSHLRSVTREDDEAKERTTPDNIYTTPG